MSKVIASHVKRAETIITDLRAILLSSENPEEGSRLLNELEADRLELANANAEIERLKHETRTKSEEAHAKLSRFCKKLTATKWHIKNGFS